MNNIYTDKKMSPGGQQLFRAFPSLCNRKELVQNYEITIDIKENNLTIALLRKTSLIFPRWARFFYMDNRLVINQAMVKCSLQNKNPGREAMLAMVLNIWWPKFHCEVIDQAR